MKHLLVITQKVDEEDDLLGFFSDWLREFARHFDRIFVITLAKGKINLPNNVVVYSLGKEQGLSRVRMLFRFYALLMRLTPMSDGVFAHMSPIFAIAAWPLTFLFRKKLILWYLHRSVTPKLKLALMLSDNLLTADTESLQIRHKKIRAIGHGINIKKFSGTARSWEENAPLRVLGVGRISPIKHFEVLIKAAGIVFQNGIDIKTTIVGKPVMPGDETYFDKIKHEASNQSIQGRITFSGYIPYSHMSSMYAHQDIAVGLTPSGGIDKTLLEAMASGCIILTSNGVMAKYLGSYARHLIFEYENPEQLAQSLIWISRLSRKEKEEISRTMQKSVVEHHNLEMLGHRIAQNFSL